MVQAHACCAGSAAAAAAACAACQPTSWRALPPPRYAECHAPMTIKVHTAGFQRALMVPAPACSLGIPSRRQNHIMLMTAARPTPMSTKVLHMLRIIHPTTAAVRAGPR